MGLGRPLHWCHWFTQAYCAMPIVHSTQFPWIRWFCLCVCIESSNLYQSQKFSSWAPVFLSKSHTQISLLKAYHSLEGHISHMAQLCRLSSTPTSKCLFLLQRSYPSFSIIDTHLTSSLQWAHALGHNKPKGKYPTASPTLGIHEGK